jgi:hypothetical protein
VFNTTITIIITENSRSGHCTYVVDIGKAEAQNIQQQK